MLSLLILVVLIALAVSFLCSIWEAVLFSTTHSHITVQKEAGHRSARIFERLRAKIDEPIAAILTLNTFAHTVGAALAGALALQVFGQSWMALFSIVLTLSVLIFSEIIPKTIGATFWPRLSRMTAYSLAGLIWVLKPVLLPLSWISRLIAGGRDVAPISRIELGALATLGHKYGILEEHEWKVVNNVLKLENVHLIDILTPRQNLVELSVEATLEEAKERIAEGGHLRIPVYDKELDNIVGVVTAYDVVRADLRGEKHLRNILREPFFIPETKPIDDLLRDMHSAGESMAVVVDEYGRTVGIVTLQDLLRQVVGEFAGEAATAYFEWRPSGLAVLGGDMRLEDVNEKLSVNLPTTYFKTMHAFLKGELGKPPQTGDRVEVEEGAFQILVVNKGRIERVAFTPKRN